MKFKKIIAAIAVAAVAASAVPLASFAEGTDTETGSSVTDQESGNAAPDNGDREDGTHTHTFGAWTDKGEDGHVKYCTVEGCEFFESELHEYGADGYTHVLKCLECGYGDGTEEAHKDDDKDGLCDVCESSDLKNLISNKHNHDIDMTIGWTGDSNGHSWKCGVESCPLKDKSGYFGKHVYLDIGNSHVLKCETCGYGDGTEEAHKGDEDGICDVCGRRRHNHDEDSTTGWTGDSNGHSWKCGVEGCPLKDGTGYFEKHIYGADGYSHFLKCLKCGYGDGAGEAHKDDDNNGFCDVCGSGDLKNLISNKHNHDIDLTQGWTGDSNGHSWSCGVEGCPGKELIETKKHNYTEYMLMGHRLKCTVCGYGDGSSEHHIDADKDGVCDVCSAGVMVHSHDIYAVPFGGRLHSYECNVEDCPAKGTLVYEAHIYVTNEYTHVLKCLECGYGDGTKEAHKDNDKNGYCDICDVAVKNSTTPVVPDQEPTDPTKPTDSEETTESTNPSTTVTPPVSSDNSSSSTSSVDTSVAETTTDTSISTGSSSLSADKNALTAAMVSSTRNPHITVAATDAKTVTDMVKAFTGNKNAKTLTVGFNSDFKITIDKKDVTGSVNNTDFSVSGKNFISRKAIDKNRTLATAEKIVQINFVSDGKLSGIDKVTIKSRVGLQYMGKTASIYEYSDGKLVHIGNAVVGTTGIVKFPIRHFGKYVIVVSN